LFVAVCETKERVRFARLAGVSRERRAERLVGTGGDLGHVRLLSGARLADAPSLGSVVEDPRDS